MASSPFQLPQRGGPKLKSIYVNSGPNSSWQLATHNNQPAASLNVKSLEEELFWFTWQQRHAVGSVFRFLPEKRNLALPLFGLVALSRQATACSKTRLTSTDPHAEKEGTNWARITLRNGRLPQSMLGINHLNKKLLIWKMFHPDMWTTCDVAKQSDCDLETKANLWWISCWDRHNTHQACKQHFQVYFHGTSKPSLLLCRSVETFRTGFDISPEKMRRGALPLRNHILPQQKVDIWFGNWRLDNKPQTPHPHLWVLPLGHTPNK